jgi:predicted transcriptional regulator
VRVLIVEVKPAKETAKEFLNLLKAVRGCEPLEGENKISFPSREKFDEVFTPKVRKFLKGLPKGEVSFEEARKVLKMNKQTFEELIEKLSTLGVLEVLTRGGKKVLRATYGEIIFRV